MFAVVVAGVAGVVAAAAGVVAVVVAEVLVVVAVDGAAVDGRKMIVAVHTSRQCDRNVIGNEPDRAHILHCGLLKV